MNLNYNFVIYLKKILLNMTSHFYYQFRIESADSKRNVKILERNCPHDVRPYLVTGKNCSTYLQFKEKTCQLVKKYFEDEYHQDQYTKVEDQDSEDEDQDSQDDDQDSQDDDQDSQGEDQDPKDKCEDPEDFDCTLQRICFYDDLIKSLQVMDILHTFWMMVEDEFEVSIWNIISSIWNITSSIWNIIYSIWNIIPSIWNIISSIWNIISSIWKQLLLCSWLRFFKGDSEKNISLK